MSVHRAREAAVEARREAAPAVALVVALELGIAALSEAKGWTLWVLPWWVWLALAGPMLALAASFFLTGVRESGMHRRLALVLLALVVVANALALVAVVGSLMTQSPTGPELLVKALAVWFANVVTFGLWLWELDGGGPRQRAAAGRAVVELQFPQDENPQLAQPGWYPRLVDYVYVSLTNSIAFSPTDAMPLTRRVKALMALETVVSVGALLLVAARAVNVLRS
jgi:hypothetical protein